ncbi:restriction endonuclease [Streptomyces longispororuber]|uniref:restriction endonuclease n=1 Tax=Streptomyces longispororuber TaxID=68230 RepID=UPI0033C62784
MTGPSRPVRRGDRAHRFDLRSTALFFVLLALVLCLVAFVVRTAARVVENRPLWACTLLVVGVAAAGLSRSRWRRFSAARYARRAAEALEEAAEEASGELDDVPAAGGAAPAVPPTVRRDASGEAYAAAPPGVQVLAEECPGVYTVQVTEGAAGPAGEGTTVALDPQPDYAALDPDDFEQAIADLCARDHCREVEVVGGACDLGADVLAVTSDGRRLVIQCKRYAEGNKVGSQDLQRFGGTCFTVHEADIAALVTTSDFTLPALEYAQQCGIVCVNGEDLLAWREGTGPSPWERADLFA